MKMKKSFRYEIRYWPGDNEYSKMIGSKLLEFKRAVKIVRRLKKSGVDAFYAKLSINL
jgi:hypothetical protein